MNDHDRNDILGPSIRFKPVFLNVDGSTHTALFVSQAYYWQTQAEGNSGFGHTDDEGRTWYWKTQQDFESMTGLSRHYQRKARESLRDMPWYEEREMGMPAKLHFRIDVGAMKRWALEHDPDVALSDEGPRTSPGTDLEQVRGGSSDKSEEGPRTDAGAHNAGASRSQTTSQSTSQSVTHAHEREDNPTTDTTPTPDDTSDPDTGPPDGPAPERVRWVLDTYDMPTLEPDAERMDAMQFRQAWEDVVGSSFDRTHVKEIVASHLCELLPADQIRGLLERLADVDYGERWEALYLEMHSVAHKVETESDQVTYFEWRDVWEEYTGERWSDAKHEEAKKVLARHTRAEIESALEASKDAGSPWPYFRAVLFDEEGP